MPNEPSDPTHSGTQPEMESKFTSDPVPPDHRGRAWGGQGASDDLEFHQEAVKHFQRRYDKARDANPFMAPEEFAPLLKTRDAHQTAVDAITQMSRLATLTAERDTAQANFQNAKEHWDFWYGIAHAVADALGSTTDGPASALPEAVARLTLELSEARKDSEREFASIIHVARSEKYEPREKLLLIIDLAQRAARTLSSETTP